jgi:tetratricopeptide (TPR) repeat protein
MVIKPSTWKGILALTSICTVLLGGVDPVGSRIPVLVAQQATSRMPQTITGQLDQNSTVLEDNSSYYATHTFEGTAGETTAIELSIDDFDAYLILLDPDGEMIAQANDGVGGTNARITLTLPTTGTYTLLVNSYGAGETGHYRLETRSASATEQALEQADQLNQQVIELYQVGRYGEAVPLAEAALAIREQASGTNHPDTATSLNNLALLYFSQSRYGEAELLYQRALAIREQALGTNHPDTANSINNLAALYESQGHYGAAIPLAEAALAIREQALGPDHPLTATSLNNLAVLYEAQGRYEEAEPLYQRALAITEQALGPDHSTTLRVPGG